MLFIAGFIALIGITSEATKSTATDWVLQLKDLLSSKLELSGVLSPSES